jgi:hypothetical protein
VNGVIALLCNPNTGFVIGAMLSIDGGYHL